MVTALYFDTLLFPKPLMIYTLGLHGVGVKFRIRKNTRSVKDGDCSVFRGKKPDD